jgi:hypothetical protein
MAKIPHQKNSSQLYIVCRGPSYLKSILQNPEKKKANEACKTQG